MIKSYTTTIEGTSVFAAEENLSEKNSLEAQFTDENICGSGASCTVYSVRLIGRHLAVKRLEEAERLNSTCVAAFRKEYEMGSRLRHNGLPVYHSMREDVDEVYLVMDFIDGCTLQHYMSTPRGRSRMDNDENIVKVMKQLIEVTDYLHRCGVIHCDIK
ncbi:MAG: protein kinase [Bacteroides sp.]|nr:protein kinase [Bacteroides sp.]MCM1413733.1 protein kinase [Bacteroides sp.]MCM1472248.1 protein kinase [Bacteroides sp.]